MNIGVKRALCASSALLSAVLVAQAARAQSGPTIPQPQVMSLMDPTGVDVSSDTLRLSDMQISVGQAGEGGLSWAYLGMGYRDPLTGGIGLSTGFQSDTTATVYHVNFGSSASVFVKSTGSTTIVKEGGSGKSLTYDSTSGVYTYTGMDGTVAKFGLPTISDAAGVDTVTKPDGEVLTYQYVASVQNPANRKIVSVSNNLGYMIHYDYVSGTDTLSKVTAINLAQEYCAPTYVTCSVSSRWMSVTFSGAPNTPNSTMTLTDNLGRVSTYTFDSIGNFATITRPGGLGPLTIGYTNGALTSAATPSGTWNYTFSTSFPYANGMSTDPTGKTRGVKIATPVSLIISTSVGTSTTQYSYATANGGDLVGVTQPENDSISYHRLASGGVANMGPIDQATRYAKTDTNRTSPQTILQAVYAYGTDLANCTTLVLCDKPQYVIDAAGARTDFTYDSRHGGVLTVLASAPNPGGAIGPGNYRQLTTYAYAQFNAVYKNSAGSLVADPNPVWRLTSITVCAADNSGVCQDQPSQRRVTAFSYTGADDVNYNVPLQLASVTRQAGDTSLASTISYTTNVFGQEKVTTGPLSGQTVRHRYDNLGRVVGVIDVAVSGAPSLATRFTYPAAAQDTGLPSLIEQGTVVDQTDAAWANFIPLTSVVPTYDSLGRKIREDRKAGTPSLGYTTLGVTQWDYDGAGRMTYEAVRMNPAVFGSLPSSAATPSTVGPAGPDRIAKFDYVDSRGLLTAVTGGIGDSSSQTQNAAAQTSYTANGKVASLTDENGNVTQYAYDGFDRLQQVTYPDNNATTGHWDFETYSYDTANRLTNVQRRDGLSAMAYCYDALGRVTIEAANTSTPCTAPPYRTYHYDSFGQVLDVNRSGLTVANAYDALGRLISQTQPTGTVQYQYDAADRRTKLIWPDGFYVTYAYDNANALTGVLENGSTQVAGFTYDYAAALGARKTITRPNGVTTTYGYDANTLRLTSLAHAGGSVSQTFGLGYNAAEQVVSRSSSNTSYINTAQVANATYGVTSLNQLTASALTYNARGDLTADSQNTYVYNDYDDKLTSVTSAGSTTNLTYDPADRLYDVTKNPGPSQVTTRYLYDGADIIAEYNGSGAFIRRYVHGPGEDEPMVWYEGSGTGTKKWLLPDQQGSIVALADASATATVNTYDEYGTPAGTNNGLFQYTGQIYLPQIDLYHYKARAYSYKLGRFLQPDPVGYDDGSNRYAYVHGDPINLSDPSGNGQYCFEWVSHEFENAKEVTATPPEMACFSYPEIPDFSSGVQDIARNTVKLLDHIFNNPANTDPCVLLKAEFSLGLQFGGDLKYGEGKLSGTADAGSVRLGMASNGERYLKATQELSGAATWQNSGLEGGVKREASVFDGFAIFHKPFERFADPHLSKYELSMQRIVGGKVSGELNPKCKGSKVH